jgi:DinB superfamily
MNEADRRFLLSELQKGRAALLDAVAGVTDGQAAFRSAPDKWSILDCIEHVTAAETFLLRGIIQATPTEKAAGPSELEGAILANGANRSRRFEAPESARPKGRFVSLGDAVAGFESARDRTLQYVVSDDGDLRACTMQHPLRGNVTGYECLLLLVMHPIRHAAQIEEIKSAMEYAQQRSAGPA